LIVHKSQQALIPGNLAAKAQVFQAYIGALYKDQGISFVEDWFIPVVDDALCEIQEFEVHDLLLDAALEDSSDSKAWIKKSRDSPEGTTPGVEQVLPIACHPKQGGAPQTPDTAIEAGQTRASDLAFFNETCAKRLRGATATWLVTQTGPGHAPEFTATVTLPGDVNPVGIGIGTTRKLAQQQAAGVALSTLGWVRPI
jgi:dsRNA-specific ribonuclease